MDFASLGHGLLGLKGWICGAGDVGRAHELFHKTLGVGGSEWAQERCHGMANHTLPDRRAFGGEIHVVQSQHCSLRSGGLLRGGLRACRAIATEE